MSSSQSARAHAHTHTHTHTVRLRQLQSETLDSGHTLASNTKTTADPAAVTPHVNSVPRRACVTGSYPSIILQRDSPTRTTNVPTTKPKECWAGKTQGFQLLVVASFISRLLFFGWKEGWRRTTRKARVCQWLHGTRLTPTRSLYSTSTHPLFHFLH